MEEPSTCWHWHQVGASTLVEVITSLSSPSPPPPLPSTSPPLTSPHLNSPAPSVASTCCSDGLLDSCCSALGFLLPPLHTLLCHTPPLLSSPLLSSPLLPSCLLPCPIPLHSPRPLPNVMLPGEAQLVFAQLVHSLSASWHTQNDAAGIIEVREKGEGKGGERAESYSGKER
ncbi:unnamed protein product [Hydatigera taeniaeformis]|uniref:Uncharacterized protein n=1 Tax=Hydatigena taeniaeformis TaxID=6205 RepID=A0A0R3WJB8_HYDTA|nr:unnamed protein product [Hydatigera taeniaeformis]